MSRVDLLALAQQAKKLDVKLKAEGPQNKEELHALIIERCGINIPREAVCPDHNAPFDFISDLYFERVGSAILIANRGGSKTLQVAILHYLNSLYKPGCESGTLGAIEAQAKRAYEHFQRFIRDKDTGKFIPEVLLSTITETKFKKGSKVEVHPATMGTCNGPHWQKVHLDEAELVQDDAIYQESRNISTSKQLSDGRIISAQDIITSTRKHAKGRMQDLLDSVEDAKKNGARPPYEVYKFCIFECSSPVDNCQVAYPELSPEEACDCDSIIKGKWSSDGRPRTLKDVCKGRFAKGAGWKPREDIINTFMQSSRGTWEAQQECTKPSTEDLYIPEFSKDVHGVFKWEPDPKLGPIYMGIDFGGANPHAVEWIQVLRYDVDWRGHNGSTIRLKEGSHVVFDEIYIADVGNMRLADKIVDRENYWRRKYPGWRCSYRFADPQGRAARLDFAQHKPPLKTTWYRPEASMIVTRTFDEHLKIVRELFEDELFYIDTNRCEMLIEELEVWRQDPKTGKQIDDFNHACSAIRYACANISSVERANKKYRSTPGAVGRGTVKSNYGADPSVPASSQNNKNIPDSETWRFTMDRN